MLKEFVDTGGLVLVAHSLPMVYPTHYLRMVSSVYDSPVSHHNDPSWVKLDVTDEIYEVKESFPSFVCIYMCVCVVD